MLLLLLLPPTLDEKPGPQGLLGQLLTSDAQHPEDNPDGPASSSASSSGSSFSLSAGFFVKNESIPFCQSGVGRGQTGFPPAYFLPKNKNELESSEH